MIRIEPGQEMDETTRAAIASGRADPAVALFIDSVLDMRGLSDRLGEAVAGDALEGETPVSMAHDALARALAAIDAGEPGGKREKAPAYGRPRHAELIRAPKALQDKIAEAEAKHGWRFKTIGITYLRLFDGPIVAEVMRIEPGAGVFNHTHVGREVTLCLHGGFSDEYRSYGPGDVSFADPSLTHTPVADQDGVCFVLLMRDAALTFTGLPGLVQRLLRL